MDLKLSVDDGAFAGALDRLVAIQHDKGKAASHDAAVHIQETTRAYLATFHHAPRTKTPSPPGGPPAMIGGRLAASIQVRDDDGGSEVGPTSLASSKNGPYGRAQELGSTDSGHPNMTWIEDGRWHSRPIRRLPERPYLKPMTIAAIASGEVSRIYERRWAEGQAEV